MVVSQFHFGSIQTPVLYIISPIGEFICLNSTLVQFKPIKTTEASAAIAAGSQFHFGSIQTADGRIFEKYFKTPCLNSTLVQFKPCIKR